MKIRIPLQLGTPNLSNKTAVFADSDVPVERLYAYLKEGKTVHNFITDHPQVDAEQIHLFAALQQEVIRIAQEEFASQDSPSPPEQDEP
jgi:uncharacterized protein (DUF433 family)